MMEVQETDKQLVQQVCEAMQAGASGEDLMISLFAPDGVLIEPFGGTVQTHTGHDEIRRRYKLMTEAGRPPDFRLTVDRIWMEGETLMTNWTCTSQVLPAPMKGQDEFLIQDGKIARLEINLLGGPPREQ